MYIQVNAHNSLTAPARLQSWASDELERALSRFSAKLSRIEVYLSDENKDKEGANDKRCAIEAKLDGFPMMAVAHQGDTIGEALLGATEKLERILDKKIGKLQHHKGHTPVGGEPFADLNPSRDEEDVDQEFETL
ncbi:MAG TPA: HPF/RaiA family ribosome-associated protein [Oligoflexus sp.]|uniref:HPF/RaiA family ribosome-associated protein n=1 Tax=Oligoflexus sp. TaxID=1971216 RepID=UPI002D81091D|nr:HPF/RaiA family ribosome-associated protein [Oligoflexus sp.]HET9239595.1 HPF/RaiA family ribosome-associated protein [Oligoflexus sp.]